MKTNHSNQIVMSIFSNNSDFGLSNRTPEGFHICSHGIYPMVQTTEQKPLAHNAKQMIESIFQWNANIHESGIFEFGIRIKKSNIDSPNQTPAGFNLGSQGIYPVDSKSIEKPLAHNAKQLLKSIFQWNANIHESGNFEFGINVKILSFGSPNETPAGFNLGSQGIYPVDSKSIEKPLAHNAKQMIESIFQRNTKIFKTIAISLLLLISITVTAQPQLENKSSSSRPAKSDKAQFATANEHLAVERNSLSRHFGEEIDDLGQALNAYLKIAAENNPGLKYQFNNYMAALQRVDQVASLPDPQIAFGYFILPVETRNGPQTFKLSYSQMFPWFGTLNNQESMTTHRAKSNYEAFEEAKSQLFLDVKSAYYQLYFIEKSQRITKENIQILETFKSLALIKIEAGKASAVDELRVEMQLADLENKLLYLRDQWVVNTVKFNRLLNVKNNAVINLPDSLWANDFSLEFSAAMDSLKANNHQLRNFDHKMKSYQNQEMVAKKKGTPNILLGADYIGIGDNGLGDNSGKDALFVKVGITIPMYRKKYNGAIQEAALMQQVTEDQKADKINALETLFEKTWSEYLDAKRRVYLFAKQSRLAQKAIRILQSEYQSNGSNFEEVLRMEKDLLKYELETQKALADKQAAIAFLEYLIGR